MAKATIAIDPVTRIEGHLKAQVVVENGKVVDAHLTGGMFRGFEQILKGRDPRDSTRSCSASAACAPPPMPWLPPWRRKTPSTSR